ncbi:DNA gyrase inhibitor YacG [Legionella erythra]|uniref:DNA gyrase inhibitor YacG n=2 Tax=Legionella erythra TaxID=448 RepID=A0A0W0TUE0_LEGER|nr:DNA gyrase inhibitor YacG [Legionella erythra]
MCRQASHRDRFCCADYESPIILDNTMKTKKQIIKCPTCGKPDTWDNNNSYKPFCSHRCKLIDLGEWASESRKIPGNPVNPEQWQETDDVSGHD